jgi:hypothetical protein
MPYFCIFAHPQMPLVRASVEKRRKDLTRDGFALRYSVDVSDQPPEHCEQVIGLLDAALGSRTKAHGVYQAKFEDVMSAFEGLPRDPPPTDHSDWLRPFALMAAVALTVGMCVLLPLAVIFWMFIAAVQRQSGLVTMAESAVVWSILDWRPTIHRLIHYSRSGIWPK